MNNNRQQNNNNRRRGRNNNNRPQNNNRSGVDYQNAIDNRARGNASQMLEKYKKLASDAQHNDDRVNAEYYLQFADHYFRVLADFRSRQEARQEERRPRDEWRDEERDDTRDDSGEELDAVASGNDTQDSDAESETAARQDRRPRNDRNARNNNDRNDRAERPERGNERRPPRRHHSEERDEAPDNAGGLDLAVLPPSIATATLDDSEEAPVKAPRSRARRAKSANDEDVVAAAE